MSTFGKIKVGQAVLRIVAIYALFGCLWIYASDSVLAWLVHDPAIMTRVEIVKGFVFVFLTAALLYLLLYRYIRQLASSEQSVRESEERLRAVVEDQTEIICRFKADGTITFVNDVYCRFFGKSRAELLGAHWQPNAFPEDIPIVEEQLRRLSASNPVVSIENRVYSGAGEARWMQFVNRGIFDREGRLIETQAVGRDITERKQIEALLLREQDLYRDLVNTIPAGMYRLRVRPAEKWSEDNWRSQMETNYSVDMASDRFCEITGISRQEFEGNPESVPDRIHPEDYAEFIRRNADAVVSMSLFSWEGRMLLPDQRTIWAHFESIPRLLENGEVIWTGIVYDISERKQAEKELIDKNTELERFTYTVSHDLKSPLITIQSYAGMIGQDLEEGCHGRIPEDLRRIADASAKMGLLLDDLLQLSRVGRMMSPPARVDMGCLVKDVLAQLAGPLNQKRVEVRLQSDLPAVQGDQRRIAEVFQNLVENALKYMGDQESPRIVIGVREEGNKRIFFVSDNGSGIDPAHHESIFGLFNKIDNSSAGTGIGLALVKRIVEVHGGKVWVESEGPGKGSTFCFTLAA
jgi:PAS domain S-box-containing protein